jgi:hypothetical protein
MAGVHPLSGKRWMAEEWARLVTWLPNRSKNRKKSITGPTFIRPAWFYMKCSPADCRWVDFPRLPKG